MTLEILEFHLLKTNQELFFKILSFLMVGMVDYWRKFSFFLILYLSKGSISLESCFSGD